MFNIKQLKEEISLKVETPTISNYVEISDASDAKNFCVLPSKYVESNFLARMKNFKVYDDDVWIISYPKTGTTWMCEMIWLLMNDLNFELAREAHQNDRIPFIERGGIFSNIDSDSIGICENLQRPRCIKSHLPVFLLPNELFTVNAKIVYVTRNPKDTAISFYHHYRHLEGYDGTKDDFLNAFLNDKLLFSPMHVQALEFWKLSKLNLHNNNNNNIHYAFYEDMKRNLQCEVKSVMKFLGKSFSQAEIDKLCEHLSFDSMKCNPSCNFEVSSKSNDDETFQFIRKGEAGAYKKELSSEENERFNEYMKNDDFDANGFAFKL